MTVVTAVSVSYPGKSRNMVRHAGENHVLRIVQFGMVLYRLVILRSSLINAIVNRHVWIVRSGGFASVSILSRTTLPGHWPLCGVRHAGSLVVFCSNSPICTVSGSFVQFGIVKKLSGKPQNGSWCEVFPDMAPALSLRQLSRAHGHAIRIKNLMQRISSDNILCEHGNSCETVQFRMGFVQFGNIFVSRVNFVQFGKFL